MPEYRQREDDDHYQTPHLFWVNYDRLGFDLQWNEGLQASWQHAQWQDTITQYIRWGPPQIPNPKDITALRHFYRQRNVQFFGGGLISLSTIEGKGYTIVEAIEKMPLKPQGMAYEASILIPFGNVSWEIRLRASQAVDASERENKVYARLLAEGRPVAGAKWFRDPYDPEFKAGVPMNWSEHESYDEEFGLHPVGRVRTGMKMIKKSLRIKNAVNQLPPF